MHNFVLFTRNLLILNIVHYNSVVRNFFYFVSDMKEETDEPIMFSVKVGSDVIWVGRSYVTVRNTDVISQTTLPELDIDMKVHSMYLKKRVM